VKAAVIKTMTVTGIAAIDKKSRIDVNSGSHESKIFDNRCAFPDFVPRVRAKSQKYLNKMEISKSFARRSLPGPSSGSSPCSRSHAKPLL